MTEEMRANYVVKILTTGCQAFTVKARLEIRTHKLRGVEQVCNQNTTLPIF